MNKKKSNTYIYLMAILACLFWSTAVVATKITLKYATPFFIAGIRFILAGLIITPLCGEPSRFFKTIIDNFKIILLLGLFQTFIMYGLCTIGLTYIPGALGAIVIGASPLIFAVTAHIILPDDKLSWLKSLILLVGLAGIIIISINRKPWTAAGLKEVFGILLLITGIIASAIGDIIVSNDKKNLSPLILNTGQFLIGGFMLFILSLVFEGRPGLVYPAEFYIALGWLSLLSAIAFSIWFYLLKLPHVKVSELNVWTFIIPMSGTILSWIVLPDESPSLVILAGMLCVVASIILFQWVAGKKREIF